VRKIAVLRANALGDFIFTLPALDAIRAVYPQAEIVLLGRGWHADFLRGRPGAVDRVEPVPGEIRFDRALEENPAQVLGSFLEAQADQCYDLVLQFHGGGRTSNPFVLGLGARVTAGLKAADAPPLDRWIPYVFLQNEVLRYLEVAGLVGAPPVRLEPSLAVTPADLAEAHAWLPDTARPLVALHPGVGDVMRRWSPDKFSALGDALVRAGARVVLTGTHPERDLVARVQAGMKSPALDLCGRLSLGGLAGLLSRCRLVVSNDSGPLHLARAVGAATVGIYWCVNLVTAGSLFSARHRPVLSWRLDCPVCGRDKISDPCAHPVSFVEDIPLDEVLAHALDLFNQG